MVVSLTKAQAKRLRALATQASGAKVADVDAALDAFEALIKSHAAANADSQGQNGKRARHTNVSAPQLASKANGSDAGADTASEEAAALFRKASDAHFGWRVTVPNAEHFVESGDEETYLSNFGIDEVVAPAYSAPGFEAVRDTSSSGAMLRWLLSPVPAADFMRDKFDRRALLVRRPHAPQHNSGCFGAQDVWDLLEAGVLRYGLNVDVTTYTVERQRETFDYNSDAPPTAAGAAVEPEVADAAVVRRRFENGASVRVLHPQRFSDSVWRVLSLLEDALQCAVGCNVYLTPPASQGFAPHYDDVDVFVLQVEGRKRWRVYAPLPGHALPRVSSPDFNEATDNIGEPLLDTVLQPGDLLYLPRGTLHQAEALQDEHSLHLTVSANQQKTWLDFLAAEALKEVEQSHAAARRATPHDMHAYVGLLHASDPGLSSHPSKAAARAAFTSIVHQLAAKLVEAVTSEELIDAVADQQAAALLAARLPPVAQPPPAAARDDVDTSARLWAAAPNIAVIVDEGEPGCLTLHHCVNNQRAVHASAADDGSDVDVGSDSDSDRSGGTHDGDVRELQSLVMPQVAAGAIEPFLRSPAGAVLADVLKAEGLDAEDEEAALEAVCACVNIGVLTDVPPAWAQSVMGSAAGGSKGKKRKKRANADAAP